jgi:hypothetical protein
MIHIQKIRKLIFNLLEYYSNKDQQHSDKYLYYTYSSSNFLSEFECLMNEKRIGVYTNLCEIDALICINLLAMLYEREFKFIIKLYKFIFDNNISIESIKFEESLDNTNFWIKLLNIYYLHYKLEPTKYNMIPIPYKNYKSKKSQIFYKINEIKIKFYATYLNKINTLVE